MGPFDVFAALGTLREYDAVISLSSCLLAVYLKGTNDLPKLILCLATSLRSFII